MLGARNDEPDDAVIDMKPEPEPSNQEVLAGLIERVTYHAAEAALCNLLQKGQRRRRRLPKRQRGEQNNGCFWRIRDMR